MPASQPCAFSASAADSDCTHLTCSTPVNIAVAFALNKMAASWQGDAFFKHTIAGGARRSNWVVFGIIMATFAGLMVGTMAVFLAFGAFD